VKIRCVGVVVVMLVFLCVSKGVSVGSILCLCNVFFAHAWRCWAGSAFSIKIDLCNISRPHSPP